MNSIGQWLHDWQTLVGAMLAIAAAGASIWYVRKQIGQAESHEQSRLKRRLAAARATLPLTLSGVMDYVETAIASLKDLHHEADDAGVVGAGTPFSPPAAPVELIPALERMIEATNDPVVSGRLADLVSEIQILNSRLTDTGKGEPYSPILQSWVTTLIIQAAVVYAQTSSLFEYARRQSEGVSENVSWGDVTSALNNLHLWGERYLDIWETVQNRRDGAIPPQSGSRA